MSRLRDNPEKLFEVFLEVGKPNSDTEGPFILQKYPLDYNDEEVLKSVPKFAFPCNTERYTTTVDHFTFTLTDLDSKFKFGFCRHATGAQTCFCIVSFLPWFEVFYNFLNILAEITNRSEDDDITHMLRAAYVEDVPSSGEPVTVVYKQEMFSFKAPEANKLPSIPASRNLTEYYNAVDISNMMIIFASMLHERRIVVTSKKLSRLTAVVHAASSLLYPMFWQHLFIPVLPAFLIDYLSAPMPFVIGVHSKLMEKVRVSEMGDAVIVDADNNTVTTEFDDLEDLPDEMLSYLKRHLKGDKVKTSMQGTGDVISKTFMMSLVKLIGGYRDALKFVAGETITFLPEIFIQTRQPSMQPFLENMLELQIFQQFINDRLDMLNDGRGFTDMFEQECLLHADKLNAQTRYNEWLGKMRKQGKKLHRGGKDVWSDFKVKAGPVMKEARGVMDIMTHRAGPAMSSAVETVKTQGQKAYSKARTKIKDFKKEDEGTPKKESTPKLSKSVCSGPKTKSFSKEKPVMSLVRGRPSTIVGAPIQAQRPPRPSIGSPSDEGTPGKPQILVRQASSEKPSRMTDHIKQRTNDDSDLLRYSRVSCNLMSDPDIQHAMYKSASAENLPKSNLQTSDSSGTITSDSSLDHDHDPSDVPYIDEKDGPSQTGRDSVLISYSTLLNDDDSGIVMRCSSSSLDKTSTKTDTPSSTTNYTFKAETPNPDVTDGIPPPRPPPRKSMSPNVADKLIKTNIKERPRTAVEDRIIKPNIARERPLPAPRRCSIETNQQGALLINFENESGDATNKKDFNFANEFENFDGINHAGDYVTLSHKDKQTPNHLENNARRSSISRTPAVKYAQNETPKRPNIRRERSPMSPDDVTQNVSQTGSMFDFDPLNQSNSSMNNEQKTVNQPDTTECLMKDWDINDLTSVVKNTPSQAYGNTSYTYGQPTPLPRQSINTSYYTPPPSQYQPKQQPPQPVARQALNFQNPLANSGNVKNTNINFQTQTQSPGAPPRPKTRTSLGGFSSQSENLQTKTRSSNNESVNQSDPFADLLSLNQSATKTSPSPAKPSWQTFD